MRGWCPRAPPKAGAPQGQGGGPGGGGGGSLAGGKAGGDYPPHMDAILKGPPAPPTPDILSSLSRRGISDLIVAVPPRRALRRIANRRPPSSLARVGVSHRPRRSTSSTSSTSSSSSSSPTCLDPLRLAESPTSCRPFLGTERRARGSSVAAGSETILSGGGLAWHPATTTLTGRRAKGEFFTHRIFTSRRRAFDAYFTIIDQRRAGRSHRLTAAFIFRVGGHIDRLRPQAPNWKVQPRTKLREQCRAALPRGLCKVSDLFIY